MKKLFLLWILALAPLARGAAGDILSVTVLATGWQADVVIEGLNVGGTYSFGLGTNNDPATGTPKITFTVVSLGYDDTGAATTSTRTVYGTHEVRKAYPNATTNEESFSTNTTVRIALSDFIYAKDIAGSGFSANVSSGTAPVVSILSGFYTYSATPNNASGAGFAVTNNSTATHPKCVGNWTQPPAQRVTGNFNLHAAVFHGSGQSGRPVRTVKFTVTDQNSHTVTTTITAPSIDPTMGDAVPVIEYVGLIDVSTLTQGDVLTCNFIAYPWIGDTGSQLDTSAGTTQPTALYGPITMLNDKSNTYGVTCALVDPTGSDAGANTVYDAASFDPATAYKFLTIGKAAAAIASYNNTNHSRNDVGAGEVHLNDGNYGWTGSVNTYGAANPNTWIIVKRATTSSSRAAVVINAGSGNGSIRNLVKWQGLTFTAAGVSTVTGQGRFWMDDCTWNPGGTAPVYQATVSYITRSDVRGSMPLAFFSAENSPWALVRGCNFNTYTGTVKFYTMVGNIKTDTSAMYIGDHNGAIGPPAAVNSIFAFNRLTSSSSSANLVGIGAANTHGLAVIQNVLENANNTQPLLWIGADSSTATINNAIVWNNTLSGQRANMGYNDTGSDAVMRLYWSVKNSIWEDDNTKSDTFGTPNSARIGNWSQLYGVGYSGNFDAEVFGSNMGAGGAFQREFMGLKCYQPASTGGQPPGTSTNSDSYIGFKSRQSRTQAAAGAGGGDYRLSPGSPALGFQRDWLLPFDIAGVARGPLAPAGAYAVPNASSWFLFF